MNATLVCGCCKRQYPLHRPLWRCPCGGLLDITGGQVVREVARKTFQLPASGLGGMWDFRCALPMLPQWELVTLGEPVTPLLELRTNHGVLLAKADHLLPTGSFKDRGSAVLVTAMKGLGVVEAVEDSSGNAGASLAAYCARAGIRLRVFAPSTAPPAKLAAIRCHGAELVCIAGSREDVAAAALEEAQHSYYASHACNPFFVHGVKTGAFELWHQLGGATPDLLLLPVGNGTLLLGLWQGFQELARAGLVSKLPRLVAVQASACAPLARRFAHGDLPNPGNWPCVTVEKGSVAGGIAVAQPVQGERIVQAVRESGGFFCTVEEVAIVEAHRDLLHQGVLVEPTSAVSFAALRRPDGPLASALARCEQPPVTVLTGHGLKDISGLGG